MNVHTFKGGTTVGGRGLALAQGGTEQGRGTKMEGKG